jgi:hypothetical protein
MKPTLLATFALLLAGCGSTDSASPPAANEAESAETTVNEAAPAPSTPSADPRRADVINAMVKTVGEVDAGARTAIGFADIGGDDREEALVYLVDPGRCGSGGCSLIILTPSGKGWRSIGQTSVTQLPVHRLLTRKDGWNDLAVGIGGGGGPSGTALLRFANGRYPSNPSVQPILNRLPEGARELIPDNDEALSPAR